MRKKRFALLMAVMLVMVGAFPASSFAVGGIELYTPYTGIAVTPGESINYSFEVMNETAEIQQVSIEVANLPEQWSYELISGGWQLHELAIKPNEFTDFSINVDVPLEVEKGTYSFDVIARNRSGVVETLPIQIDVTEEGTFRTELTSEQPNMEGHADSTFTYKVTLRNRTAEEQRYALKANAPEGWGVSFQVDGENVTSVTAESNATKDFDVVVTPPPEVEAGDYSIPISASTNSTNAEVNLETVITGNYAMEVSTPSGKLSEDITAGREKTIQLAVTNTGSVPINDVKLSAQQPVDWTVTFAQDTIPVIEPGQTETVQTTIQASKDAIAGDYIVSIEANGAGTAGKADFRMQVETSLLWGWIGVLIIACVLAGIYYMMRKYGRR
ncbi:NEW3 domain-containing protein [Alkalihalobacillus oceani]|uniref:NEW3 domain-containing protein n=1 Tax=Halalkalibacter oceani TaxID=1653776 RepID=A0A9X2IQY1_9BACI|nr:NEW3 domain-containing protein [Halalkalibacter oceani]MCM3716331.1 NEW3 domain-containing protein [Halalkalibacter oceani]